MSIHSLVAGATRKGSEPWTLRFQSPEPNDRAVGGDMDWNQLFEQLAKVINAYGGELLATFIGVMALSWWPGWRGPRSRELLRRAL